jgi:hypothetical protein
MAIPKWIYYALLPVFLLAGVYFFAFNPAEQTHLFPSCPFHAVSGWYCPGCGSQRAIHQLLHGDFVRAWGYNPLVFFAILMVGYHWGVQGLNQLKGVQIRNLIYRPLTTWIILVLVLAFWILRNLPFAPFDSLAP